MKQCAKCGRQFPDELQFCPEDGAALGPAAFIQNVSTPTIVRSVGPKQRGSGSGLIPIVIVGIILLLGVGVLAAAGIGGYLYYSSKRNEAVYVPANTSTRNGRTNQNDSTNGHAVNGSNLSSVPPPPPSISNRKEPPFANSNASSNGKLPVPKQISGGVLNGKATYLPKPAYPPAARAVRASGSVSVQVLVDEEGNVVSASAVSGHPLLRQAAVQAARGARFTPTLLAGQPVKVSGVITFNFVP